MALWRYVACVLLSLAALSHAETVQHGKLRITTSKPEGVYCQTIFFPTAFTGLDQVRIFLSVNHGDTNSSNVHDVTFPWVELPTARNFKACMLETGEGSHGNATIDWLAMQGASPTMQQGSIVLNAWTTGTQCATVTLPKPFSHSSPKVLVSARHAVLDRKQDAAAVWTEGRDNRSFRVCMREASLFSGGHKRISVDWVAFEGLPGETNITETDKITFASGRLPTEQDNYASCKLIPLTYPYYTPPVVILSANGDASTLPSDKYALSAWVEGLTTKSFKACTKELISPNSATQEVTIEYVVVGDIHPCLNVTCEYFAECEAFAADDAQCVCPSKCPAYIDQVCGTNGQTFDNLCLFKKHVCRIKGNFSYFHHGSCRGFPVQQGSRSLHRAPHSHLVCETINFTPYTFYPDKDVNVIATVNHYNSSDSGPVMDAPAVWVEDVIQNNFTVCTMFAGRYERPGSNEASVDWLAYQGSPQDAVTGAESFSRWWTGTSCKHVTLPAGALASVPTVLATVHHTHRRLKRDAAMAWVEDVSTSGFELCLRELQNFDGVHQDITASWMAFDNLHRPLFKEHGLIHFSNRQPPSKRDNYAFCKHRQFSRSYSHVPSVLLTPTIATKGKPSVGSVAWVEQVNATGAKVCVKQVYDSGYLPLTVNYAVLSDVCGSGWRYYKGYCYKTSNTCLTWKRAESACAVMSSGLVSVHNHEENVFIQQQHNGEKSWVGLSDVTTEGQFVWADGSPTNFTNWAPNQPNDYKNQDCVHTLGVNYGYKWNDVPCTACHNYTCKRDYNECSEGTDGCDHTLATCVNTPGSYACVCPAGYTVSGYQCNDVNECGASDRCHVNATCTNTIGSYICACKPGFTGNGFNCTDVDECTMGTHSCHANAQCDNTIGSYTCRCNNGHQGNGQSCSDIDECGAGSHGCHANARCINTPGSYICRCVVGYGDGKTCRVEACSKFALSAFTTDNIYTVSTQGFTFQVYCDITSDRRGWTLAARFSNNDGKNWMRDDGLWWYDLRFAVGDVTNPSTNSDMISPAFWLLRGKKFKLTRSDDSSHTALLTTTTNCIGGQTFRDMITGYGNFRNGTIWAKDMCRGSCPVQYGGWYTSTEGFSQHSCSSNIQSSNNIGLWCNWDAGDGTVMMIGGGGPGCSRADHGVGATERDQGGSFVDAGTGEMDFSNEVMYGAPQTSYSLNLWIEE
ncbi:uncharacterized protein LOC5502715 [Nematostella vectensis]|uniref:uncharacterized protein LOC5502715 n=1 Tax=Nematostella vectensis TaxID=45351 RepID=UPI002076F735|nr:uncharacterized protein LOC5502715 [Nematostella vectensis]